MTRRDYFIIFCLLLPFFITLPWALVTRSDLNDARARNEQLQDSLSMLRAEYAALENKYASRLRDAVEVEAQTGREAPRVTERRSEVTTRNAIPRREEVDLPTFDTITDDIVNLSPNPNLSEQFNDITRAGLKAEEVDVKVYRVQPRSDTDEAPVAQRQLAVQFELNDVDRTYWGNRALYLVVTDQKGEPVLAERDLRVTVPIRGNDIELSALVERKVSLGKEQVINIDEPITGPLHPGRYRLQLFSDAGPLGVRDFEVK